MSYDRSELHRGQCWGFRCHRWYSFKVGENNSSAGKEVKNSCCSEFLTPESLSMCNKNYTFQLSLIKYLFCNGLLHSYYHQMEAAQSHFGRRMQNYRWIHLKM